MLQETVEQHQKSRSLGADIPRDFIDAYLDEVKQQSVKNSSTTFTCEFKILNSDIAIDLKWRNLCFRQATSGHCSRSDYRWIWNHHQRHR